METKTTYTFSFNFGDRNYTFNISASTKGEAMNLLKEDLVRVISEINSTSHD